MSEIFTVNLDPAGQQFTSKGYQEKVPLPDHSAQLVFALEIVEHLTSPFHLTDGSLQNFEVRRPSCDHDAECHSHRQYLQAVDRSIAQRSAGPSRL